jgi:hypothetical protein
MSEWLTLVSGVQRLSFQEASAEMHGADSKRQLHHPEDDDVLQEGIARDAENVARYFGRHRQLKEQHQTERRPVRDPAFETIDCVV